MARIVLAFIVLLCLSSIGATQTTRPKAGLKIVHATPIEQGIYLLPSEGGAVTISGDNLDLDFRGVELRGSGLDTPPDQRSGVGVRVTGKNVTIRNLRVRGYKIALWATGADRIRLIDCDFSDNWKQRLLSNEQREDLSDWMSFHQNEKDEWTRFGAGAYLVDCDNFEVKGLVVRRGQCGLMITRSDNGLVWNCDLSYNSAIGIGMYRSSNNRIMHNRVDYNVRGYSHGVYNRGQDSAALLMYEQCNENVVAYNSMTHSGDGLFLWAGQSTMDTGKGGCNDNLFYGNDFSHAPTNGIEATFSRNKFLNNLVMECWHGVWGGYSYESQFAGNVFAHNAEAIAIEHGQDNLIEKNLFLGDRIGLMIWQNPKEDPNWGYPKSRDTRSRDLRVENNLFVYTTNVEAKIKATRRLTWKDNFAIVQEMTVRGGAMRNFYGSVDESGILEFEGSRLNLFRDSNPREPHRMTPGGNAVLPDPDGDDQVAKRFEVDWNPLKKPGQVRLPGFKDRWQVPKEILAQAPKPLRGGLDPFDWRGRERGRQTILMTEWGPYDGASAVVLPQAGPVAGPQYFRVLGPMSGFDVVEIKGGTLMRQDKRSFGWRLMILWDPEKPERIIRLRAKGAKSTDNWGRTRDERQPLEFGWSEFRIPTAWSLQFFAWDKDSDPRTNPEAFTNKLKQPPLATQKATELNLAGRVQGAPLNNFATIAETTINVPAGEYIFDLTTDDGAKMWIDGELVVADAWKYQGPTLYSVKRKLSGNHKIRIEHFQIDGYMALQLRIRKG